MYHLIFVVKIKINMRVCILGSSLSSLTLAKALVSKNIYVDVVAKKKPYFVDKTRTLGISKSNIEYLNANVINIQNILWKINKIEIFTENLKSKKLLNFENNSNYLFSIIKNHRFYEKLEKNLSKNKFFKRKTHKINFNFSKNYDLVINTEYNNWITKKYFYKKILKKYNSNACTTLIKHEKIKNNIATQIFTKKGPLAFLPISEFETSIVYSLNNLLVKKNKNIIDLINQYNFKYNIKKIKEVKTFELNSTHLRSYHYKNILAFGDLIHQIHPFAGQGFNMTIRDIKNLMQIINKRILLGLPLDQSVNYEFEKKYKNKNFLFSSGIDLIYEFFNVERKIKNSFLSKSLESIGKISYLNKMFKKIADKGII